LKDNLSFIYATQIVFITSNFLSSDLLIV